MDSEDDIKYKVAWEDVADKLAEIKCSNQEHNTFTPFIMKKVFPNGIKLDINKNICCTEFSNLLESKFKEIMEKHKLNRIQ